MKEKRWCTSKYILTKIDNLRCFAYASPCEVEKPIKDIRMAVMKSNPAKEERRHSEANTQREREKYIN
jgi:hypothetical protein